MTNSAFWIIMVVMATGAQLSAQYSVELEPDTAKRQVVAIDYGAATAELHLHPQTPWRIGSSRIAAQDDFLWSGPYGSTGTSEPQPYLHRYLMLNAHSSREYVKITGVLTQDGSGGTPPWFRVTVPSVDIDWAGYESAAQEDDEDDRQLFCPVTDDMSKRRKLVIRNPLDSGKLRDDPSLLGSNPDMRLTLASGYANCFRLLKADGTVFNTGSFYIHDIPSWPLELYVDALPGKDPSELEITLEGPAGPDNARTLDKIRGTTIIKVVFDRVENADEIGTLTSGVTVYATSKKQPGDVIVYLKTEPTDMPLPPNTVTWAGGNSCDNQLQRRVSRGELRETSGEFVFASVNGQPQIFKGLFYMFRSEPQATLVSITRTQVSDNSLCRPEDFGRTDFDRSSVTEPQCGIYYKDGYWWYLFERVSYEIGWGVHDRGRSDVPDASANPFPLGRLLPENSTETEKKQWAKDDLKPLPNVPMRDSYWSSNISEDHEKFHMDEYHANYYTSQLRAAETTFEVWAKNER